MKKLFLILISCFLLGGQLIAQTQYTVNFEFTTQTSESLLNQSVRLFHKTYGLEYNEKLDVDGKLEVQLMEGTYLFQVSRNHFTTIDQDLTISKDTTIKVTLLEEMRQPYALNVSQKHDIHSGLDTIDLTWNRDNNFFFDGFESYDAFAIDFNPWTGYDGDKEVAAALTGSYQNRGLRQYATIFNALKIDPPVWFDYPVLRPYAGSQYVGFIRTLSGKANNDWIISPQIHVGIDNIVSFMAKAGDAKAEKFVVHISTTGTDIADFTALTEDNYQEVDYKSWHEIKYDLSAYEGQDVHIAIQCVSKAAFMLMVDNFFVGNEKVRPAKAKRIVGSIDNPNETFELFVDGKSVGTTDQLTYQFTNLSEGQHTLGVKAIYRSGSTEISTIPVTIAGTDNYARLQINFTANGGNFDQIPVRLLATNGQDYTELVQTDKVIVNSLPKGDYLVGVEVPNYATVSQQVSIQGDKTLAISLKENKLKPVNLIADRVLDAENQTFDVKLYWNQVTGWEDSFESYTAFAQQFGNWITYDMDKGVNYGLQVGSNKITFPGVSEPGSGLIFNPFNTQPQCHQDTKLCAADGVQYVAFFSAQKKTASDWLISEKLPIHNGDVVRFYAKSYDVNYKETCKIGVIEGDDISSFVELSSVSPEGEWTLFEVALTDYMDKEVRIAFNYVSTDKFLFQLDKVYVGPQNSEPIKALGATGYSIYQDNVKVGDTQELNYTFSDLQKATYTLGVVAHYDSGDSEMATCRVVCTATDAVNQDSKIVAMVQDHQLQLFAPERINRIEIYNTLGQKIKECMPQEAITSVELDSNMYIVCIYMEHSTEVMKVQI